MWQAQLFLLASLLELVSDISIIMHKQPVQHLASLLECINNKQGSRNYVGRVIPTSYFTRTCFRDAYIRFHVSKPGYIAYSTVSML